MRTAVIVLVLGALLVAAIAMSWYLWVSLGDVEISTAGYLALCFGALLTFAVGAGLMSLVYYSSRRGYDDEAGRD